MALADWFSLKSPLALDGEGVRLRPPRGSDYGQWAMLRRASQSFLQPWEPAWPADDLSHAAYRRRLAAYSRELDLGLGFAFLIFRKSDEALVGGLSMSNVRRGVAMMATVGYWVGAPFQRRGHTLAAVRTVSEFAFGPLGLHRLEAACVPENEPSRNLLLRAGFRQEGKAQAYLKINGVWRDHLTFGLLAGDRSDAARSESAG
jgi:ribosomal-protein-alanine N-acetyltransferase